MSAPHVAWRWDVSLGQVASFVGMVVVASLAWADVRNSDEEQTRRIEALETAVTTNAAKLAASDINQARADARFARIEELMSEVRTELRALNRRDEP